MTQSAETTGAFEASGRPAMFAVFAKGFAWVFWGLLVGAVFVISEAEIKIAKGFSVPAYIFGSCIMGRGLLLLLRAAGETCPWKERVGAAGFAVFLQIYFAPFVVWWREWPEEMVFFINGMMFLFACQMLLYYVALLAVSAGSAMENAAIRVQGLWCAASVLIIQTLPFFALIGWAAARAAARHTFLQHEFRFLVFNMPFGIFLLWLAPCSLVLGLCWKTREAALRRLCDS